jgi:adenine-specific DNA-methyltransferase
MIVSDAYCHSKYAQKSQTWFLKNSRVLRLDFCSDLKIFDAAVHNVIYFFQRMDGVHCTPERRVHRKYFGNILTLPSDEQAKLTYRAFFPQMDQHNGIFRPTLTLGEVCYVSYGLAASSDEKLHKGEFVTKDVVRDFQDATLPKRYIEGKDIRQWFTPSHQFLEWGTKRAPHKFRRQTFLELHEAPEKLMTIVVTAGAPPVMFDDLKRFTTHTSCIFVPWHALSDVRNNSLKKAARYRGERGRIGNRRKANE